MSIKIASKLEPNTKAFIAEAIRDIVSDPDFGLALTNEARKRLEKARSSRAKTISLSEIKRRYS